MADLEVIEDDDDLFRRIVHYYIKRDGTISSSAFMKDRGKTPDNEISVELARLTNPEACASRYGDRGFRVIMLTAESPRSMGFDVRHDPLPDCYPHSLIAGDNDRDKCQRPASAARIAL